MYGASLTKTVMAYTALTLMDQGKLDLDAPLADYLERPLISYGEGQAHLAKYGPYRDLAGDERWRTITARMALTHSTGFHNFWFIEPDQKLRIHFDPGSRYSYSGEGFSLLQFTIEQGARTKGLGLDVKDLTDAIFVRLGMTRTTCYGALTSGRIWPTGGTTRANSRSTTNARSPRRRLDGHHDQRPGEVHRCAGAGRRPVDGRARRNGQAIAAHWYGAPVSQLRAVLPKAEQRPDLAAGLGVIVFEGPQGRGFYKGGHDGQTANSFVCLSAVNDASASRQRCSG